MGDEADYLTDGEDYYNIYGWWDKEDESEDEEKEKENRHEEISMGLW